MRLFKKQKNNAVQVLNTDKVMKVLMGHVGQDDILGSDENLESYVQNGIEGNPDIFSIIFKPALKFANVQKKLYDYSGKEKTEVPNHSFLRFMKHPNRWQTAFEFQLLWAISYLGLGESFIYYTLTEAGNDAGKPYTMYIAPPQNIEVKFDSVLRPLGAYTLNIDERTIIDTESMMHSRFIPSLNYEDGKQFRGVSPIKIAKDVINTQTHGYKRASKLLGMGFPPGILNNKSPDVSEQQLKEHEAKFRATWKRKHNDNTDSMGIPHLMSGEYNWIKIGLESIKDSGIIEMNEMNRAVLCNVLQVPPELFGLKAHSVYNNMKLAEKAIYNNRVKPDIQTYLEDINDKILPKFDDNPNLRYEADYSNVDALQEDKKEQVGWISQIWRDGLITAGTYGTMIGVEIPDYLKDKTYLDLMGFASDEPVDEQENYLEKLGIKY